jgi:glyoxylase-like metal-dependent hydrolase (beta-lactamase superfamily II)
MLKIQPFFDPRTYTISYVVFVDDSDECAIIDPVLDYEPNSGSIRYHSADAMVHWVQQHGLRLRWILETHAHADHLSAAQYIKTLLGGEVVIGQHVDDVQAHFAGVFGFGPEFPTDGSQFDRLVADGDRLALGTRDIEVMHTPGHTAACVSYRIGDAVFVGDTVFAPDYGTARTDFPGGDARALFHSIRRLLSLPDETRLFLCHDYLPGGRSPIWETTVAEQRQHNLLIHDGIDETTFVTSRRERDGGLAAPVLLLPSIQVNICAGHLPEPDAQGRRYLKVPLRLPA